MFNQGDQVTKHLLFWHPKAKSYGGCIKIDHPIFFFRSQQPEHRSQRPAAEWQGMETAIIQQLTVKLDPGRAAMAVMLKLVPIADGQQTFLFWHFLIL